MSNKAPSPKVHGFGSNRNSLNRIFKELDDSGLDQTQILFEQTGDTNKLPATMSMSFDTRNSDTKYTSHMSNPQAISRNLGTNYSILDKAIVSCKLQGMPSAFTPV